MTQIRPRRLSPAVPFAAVSALALLVLCGGCRPQTEKTETKTVSVPTPVAEPPVVVKTPEPEPPVQPDPVEVALRRAGATQIQRDGQGNIDSLWMENGRVTEDDMKTIASLVQLQRLYMGKMQVIDRDLLQLATLPSLRALFLEDNHITDRGVEHLKPLASLRRLSLENNRNVSDASFAYLQSLENLEEVNLRGTGVSEEGVARLKEALPGIEVYHLTIDPD